MNDREILEVARTKLEQGLCLDRKARITRSTDAEILNFAHAVMTDWPDLAKRLAEAIGYPAEWDTVCYDTLESALQELTGWYKEMKKEQNKK